ncbi:MAG: hypothetical protein ACO3S8_05400 [Aquiluna sp.]
MSQEPGKLWWVYNSETGSFSTLPTGPLLLPALLVMAIGALFGFNERTKTFKDVAGNIAKTSEWQAKNYRYQQLVSKFVAVNGDLELSELAELEGLESYMCNPRGIRR